jgi:uncharacterized protein
MEVISRDDHIFTLRFDGGEEVMAELKRFCADEGITAGSLTAIGAAQEVELACYDVDKKHYATRRFKKKLEIAGVIGTISMFEGEVVIHAHGTFSTQEMQAVAGHVNRMVISATCEMTVIAHGGPVERQHSAKIGLNLMKPRDSGT